MITTKEILALVKPYVEKKASVDEFAQSFAKLFYDIEKTGDPDALQLAYDIESELAAATAGVCSESALQGAMASLLLSVPSVSVVDSQPIYNKLNQEIKQYIVTNFTAGAVAGTGTEHLVYADIAPSAGFSLKAALLPAHQTSTDLFPTQQVLEER